MTRLRYNGLTAELGSGLTSSATAVTFAAALTHSGGTNVPTITGTDYIPLAILDSTGKLSEIVYLTAYTAAATTGTITRGRESTTGVSHSAGDAVVHGPNVADVVGATGGRYPIQDVYGGGGVSSVNFRDIAIAAPTVGNYLVITTGSEGAANVTGIANLTGVSGVTTWTKLAESAAGTAPHSEVWGGLVTATPSGTIAVRVSFSSSTFCTASLSEWAGIAGIVHASAVRTNSSNTYVPLITVTDETALVIACASRTGYVADFAKGGPRSNVLVPFRSSQSASGDSNPAHAFGFPGRSPVLGIWNNDHGGNQSAVTVALL